MSLPVLKAPNQIPDFEDLPYNEGIVSSPKIDGNRCICIRGNLYTPSMKKPRNRWLEVLLKEMISYCHLQDWVIDMELYAPSCTHHGELAGILNSYEQHLPKDLQAFVFDGMSYAHYQDQCFHFRYGERIAVYHNMVRTIDVDHVKALAQTPVTGASQARDIYHKNLDDGFEGSILRATHIWWAGSRRRGGFYKHGRATTLQATIWKLKAMATIDAIIVDAIERRQLRADYPREYDAYGHLKHPNEIAAFEPAGSLGALVVEVTQTDGIVVRTEIGFGKGWDLFDRKKLWDAFVLDRHTLVGKAIEFIHMPHGSMKGGKYRFGRLVRFRPDLDFIEITDRV